MTYPCFYELLGWTFIFRNTAKATGGYDKKKWEVRTPQDLDCGDDSIAL